MLREVGRMATFYMLKYVKKMLIEKLIDSCSAKETDTTEHRSRHSRSDKK